MHSFSSICRGLCATEVFKGPPARPRCMKRGHEIKGSHCATKPPPYSKARACYVPRSAQSCTVVQNFEALCQRKNKLLLPRQIRVMLSRLQKCAAKRRPCGYLWLWRSRVLRVVRRSAVRPSILLRPSSSSARATDDGARPPATYLRRARFRLRREGERDDEDGKMGNLIRSLCGVQGPTGLLVFF